MPGNADETPGVAVSLVGVGADGLSTYDVGYPGQPGVTLAENAQQAVLTQYTPQGAVVYNCQLNAQGMCVHSSALYGPIAGLTVYPYPQRRLRRATAIRRSTILLL